MSSKPIKLSDEYIEKMIMKAQERVDELLMIKRVWEKEYVCDDFVTLVFYTYLHTCTVAETANIINEKGFRKMGSSGKEVKYTSNDISAIIREMKPLDDELGYVCKKILDNNTSSCVYLR